jgi:hypothetical protein
MPGTIDLETIDTEQILAELRTRCRRRAEAMGVPLTRALVGELLGLHSLSPEEKDERIGQLFPAL